MASSLWGLRQTEDDEQEMARKAAAEMSAAAMADALSPAAGRDFVENREEEPQEMADLPGDVEVDLDDSPEVTEDIGEPEKPKIGIGEHARDVIRQETGKRADEILPVKEGLVQKLFGISTEGEAAALIHYAPFLRQISKMESNIEERNLGRLMDGNYSDEEIDEIVRASGDVLRNSDEEIKRLVLTEANPQMKRRQFLAMAAEDELVQRTKTKQQASSDLENKEQTTWGKIASGTLENSGYVNSFIYGSTLAGGLGLTMTAAPGASALAQIGVNAVNTMISSAPASLAGAAERASRLMKKDYAVDEADNLHVIDNNFSEMRSVLQGGAGGFVENTLVEGGTDIAIDLACLGLSKIPGAQTFIVQPLKKLGNAAVRKMMGNKFGRGLIHVGKAYNQLSQLTQFDSQPVEMLEEDIQPIFDNVFGLDKKRGEYKGFGAEVEDYRKNQLNLETQKDIFYGLIGTCLLQAGTGAVMSHRGKVPGATTAKEAQSVLVDYANVPKERVATLTDDEKIQLADAYRTMSDNPDKLVEFANRLGARQGEIMESVINRAGARMNERLKANGMPFNTFEVPLVDGKPSFKKSICIDTLTGEQTERMGVTDGTISIYDNGSGPGDERAYTVEDTATGRSFDVPNLMLARKVASLYKNDSALLQKDRENKAAYIQNVWQTKYGNTNVQLFTTTEQAVEFSKKHGVDVEKEEGFTPDRPAWRLKDGTIVMVADNINSPYEVDALFQHEIVGHNEDAMRDEFMANLDSKAVKEAQKVLGLSDEQMGDPRVQREVFANVIQQRRHNPSVMQKLKHYLNEKRRASGETKEISDADLEVMAQQWEKAASGESGNIEVTGAPAMRFEEKPKEEPASETAETKTPEPEPTVEVADEIPETEAVEPAAPKEDTRKPKDFLDVMHAGGRVTRMAIDKINLPDTQFKEGADPKTGVVRGQELQGEYFESAENAVVGYVHKDGTVELVTGRHRFDLAKRNGKKDILIRLFNEEDGYTKEDMRNLDAVSNIIDEKGSVKDYVKYFDEAKTTRKVAEDKGFLSRKKGKLAFGIHEGATDDTKASVDWGDTGGEGMISTDQAGIIAEAAPKDAHPRNKALQRILVTKALNGLRGTKLAIVARSLAEEVKSDKHGGTTGGEMQLDLFSSAEDLELLAREEKRAEYRVGKAAEYGRIAENLRTAMSKGGKLDLNAEYAKELGITNPKDKKQLEAARDKAVERANYWENAIRLNAEDKAAMDAEIDQSASKAKAAKTEIADKLKGIVANGVKKAPKSSGSGEKVTPVAKTEPKTAPKVETPTAKSVAFSEETITDAIPVDSRDGLIKVENARDGFGKGEAWFVHYAPGSEEEVEKAEAGVKARFGNVRTWKTDSGLLIKPAVENAPKAETEDEEISHLSDQALVARHYVLKRDGKEVGEVGKELSRRGIYSTKKTSIVPYRDEFGNPRVGTTPEITSYFQQDGKEIAKFDAAEDKKPEAADKPLTTSERQKMANEASSVLGIPIVGFGADGKVEFDSTAAAEAAISGKAKKAAQKPATPSVKMKDAASEKKAEAQEDALAALFSTEELNPKLNPMTETAHVLEDSVSEANAKRSNTNPKKTRKVFKLFRKYADGSYGALFIDSAKRLTAGEWYEAKSPSIENLKNLDGMERSDKFKWGKVYLIDANGKASSVAKMPSVRELNAATTNDSRYMAVTFGANGKKLYYNLGINGSGSVAGFAYRPGWHSTNAPSAAHIGKSHGMSGMVAATGQNHYRGLDEVWCEIEIPDDIDYNKSALDRAPFLKEKGRTHEKNRKEAQLDYIPLGGSYFFRTNSNADERQDWIISGAIKIVREIPREEVNRFNLDNGFVPDAPIASNKEEAQAKQNANPAEVYWASAEFDPKAFQARVGAVAELAKTYVDSGVGNFNTLVTRMAARFPDKFGKMKPYLRSVWNAVAEQMDLEEVSKKDAEAVYADAEKAYTTQTEESNGGLRESGDADNGRRTSSDGAPAEGSGRTTESGDAVQDDAATRQSGPGATVPVVGAGSGTGLSVERPQVADGTVSAGGAEDQRVGEEGRGGVASRGGRPVEAAGQGAHGSESGVQLEPEQSGDVGAGKGRGRSGVAATAQKEVEKQLPNTVQNDNYVITEEDERAIENGSPRDKARANIEAIRIVRKLNEDGRPATADEKKKLARYVGWGGLSQVFDEKYESACEREQSEGTLPPQTWASIRKTRFGEDGYEIYKQIRELLTPEEIAAAKESVLSAFFTPIRLCRAVHAALAKTGLKGGRFLETSAGIGNLIGTGNYANPRWTAVELDKVSGQILQALYPKANVRISGFEDVTITDNFMDAVISNVPFGTSHPYDANYKKYGFVIHDFFFAKAVDKLHPGGVAALITATGTLDKRDKKLIRFLSEHGGKIVGAVRLPNGFFDKNAGTDVATDVVFVQKVDGAADNSAFLESTEYRGCNISKYFVDHPEMCLGEMIPGTNQFGENALKYKAGGALTFDAIEKALADAASGMKFQSVAETQKPSQIVDLVDSNGLANGNVGVVENKIVRKINGELVELTKDQIPGLTQKLIKKGVTPQKIVRAIENLRDAFRAVVDGQLANCDDKTLGELQGKLNYEYSTFVSRYGHLNEPSIKRFIDLDYAAAPLILGMENVTKVNEGGKPKSYYGKADIFSKRTIFAKPKATHADSVIDGLRISLNETGTVDTARIAELTGKAEEDVRKELMESGRVFVNPETSGLETSDEYLSGSVRRKLKAAKAAAEIDESFKKNVEELEKVQPDDIAATDISYQLGQNWIPREIYEQFYKEAVFQNTANRLTVTFDQREHLWHVNNARGQTEWDEESGLAIEDLLERTMNGQSIVVRKRISEDEYVVDQQATTATKIVQEKIAKAFQSWMTDDIDRANGIERLYNDVMNDNVPRDFDTGVLEFYGLSERWAKNVGTAGREYQKRCIARGTFGGNLLIAHCVGAGKTFEMASVCMQLRRLGIARKPMFAVPNHMLAQWNREFHEAYPGAKVLVAEKKDLTKNNRRAFLAKAANGDWDCIIVAHSSFSRIAMSPEHQAEYVESEIADLEDLLHRSQGERGGDKKSVKKIQKKLQSLRDKLKSLLDPSKKDDTIKFEELGCDYLFIDEAHNFKGLNINTHMSNVPGVTGSVSQRAQDLEMKCRYIAKLHGSDRGVVFATGTPISNSISEMYVMMRYLAPTKMDDMGVKNFDDWAKQFGMVVNEWSPNPSGVGFREKARFSQFQNVPEMKRFFRSFSDIVLDGELNIKRPKPIEKKHVIKASPVQKAYVKSLNERMERMQSTKVDPHEDNMLKVTTEGRLLAIDPALIGVKDDTHSRANVCADEVKRIYDASTGKVVKDRDGNDRPINGTQLIFCDSGVPKKKQFKELVRTAEGNYEVASGKFILRVYKPDANGERFYEVVRGETGEVVWRPNVNMGTVDEPRMELRGMADHSIEGWEDLASVYAALEDMTQTVALWKKKDAVGREALDTTGWKKAKKPVGEAVDINGWIDVNTERLGYDPRFSNPFVQMELDEAVPETEEEQEAADDKDNSEEANGDVEVDNMLRGKFNMYAEIRKQLVRRGIPANEIAFIHDAETMTQKQALFDRVKKGEIRVLIGNTAKMGEGTNVQDMLVAIHHLDIPWKPAWITQRDGRGVRSGNMNDEIEIHKYITEGTFDVYSWDTVGRKAKFIENAMNGKMDQRVIEDADSTVMSLEEGKAAAAGDPRILERVKLIKAIEKKQMEFDTQVKAFDRANMKMRVAERELMEKEQNVAKLTEAIRKYNENKGDKPFTFKTMEEQPKELTDNTEIARAIQDKLGFFARKGSDLGIVGSIFGYELRFDRDGTNAKVLIKELGVEMPVTILPGTGAAFPPTDLSKLKTQITNHTSERALQGFDEYLVGYRRRLEVAKKGVENAQNFDRKAAEDDLGQSNLRLAKLNKAFGIKDGVVNDIALAFAQENGLKDDLAYLQKEEKAGAEPEKPGAEFSTSELDPKRSANIYDILPSVRTKADADTARTIANMAIDGQIRIRPYTQDDFRAGSEAGGAALVSAVLVARGSGGRNERDSLDARGTAKGQADSLVSFARHTGIFVGRPLDFVKNLCGDGFHRVGSGGDSTVYAGNKHDYVYKIRGLKYADQDFGGATVKIDDVLLSNAVFGDKFACELIGIGQFDNGMPALVFRQPYAEENRNRAMQFLLDSYMDKLGFDKTSNSEYVSRDGRLQAVDMRIGDNVGLYNGSIFILDPQVEFTADYLKLQNAWFSTDELDPKKIGIAKRDIEAQARSLGRVPFRPKPKTWPEVYQRSEAMLNQTGFIESLVEDAAKYARPLTDAQTIAVGEYQNVLAKQYAEIRELRQQTENDLAAADPSDAEYIRGVTEALKQVKEEETKVSKRYATCYKAFRMSKAEQGRALAANKAQFSEEMDFLGMKEARKAALGRDLTPEELKQLHEIADKARDLDEEGRAELWAAVKAQAEKTIKDLFFKDGVKRSGTSRGGKLTDYRKKYLDAMKHLEIYRDTVGGSLIGITGDEYGTWNKPLFDLLLWHRYENPDITAAEALAAVTEDVNTYIAADEQTVARILTGFERSWDINRHDDTLRGGRDLRSQILTQLQIEKLLNKEMPGKTGPIQADPSQALRDARHTRDVLKNDLEDETNDPHKLQSRQKRWMKWYDNRIEDLKKEIAAGERLPHAKRTLEWTEEMKQKRLEYEQLVLERDRVCGPKLTEEERVKLYERSLERTLRRAVDRLQRAKNDDFSKRPQAERPTNDYIESLKKAIKDTNDEWRQEKKDRLNFGRTQEELKKFNDARERTRTKRVQYWQSLTAPTADRTPVKRPPIPMSPEQQARYDELGKQMKKLRRQVMDMREHDELMKKPWALRNGIEYTRFINGLTRGFLATADHSAVLRQMAQLSQAHPVLAAQVFKNTIGTAFSDEKAVKINAEYLADPRIKEAVDKGWLSWRNLEAEGGANDVEMFSTLHSSSITIGRNADGTEKRLALDDIKGVGAVLRGSERIYASYINALSAEIYLALTNADNFTAKLLFGQTGLTDFTKKDIAARINMANGSAQIDNAKRKNFMNQLTGIFWAPKLALSRAQLAVGWDIIHPLLTKDADVKTRLQTAAFNAIEHARAKLAMIALGTLMLMLAGDDDDKEKWRRASLFQKFIQSIKPRVGSTTLDFSGGEAGWYQLMAKWATLEKETGTGKKQYLAAHDGHKKSFGASIMTDTFRFAQGKFNPLLSNAIALWTGEDYTGQPFGFGKLMANTFVPLGASDITNAFVENGLGRGLLLSPFIVFGAGGNTYPVKRYETAVNQFKELSSEYDKIREDRQLDLGEKLDALSDMEEKFPELKKRGQIDAKIKNVRFFENEIRKLQKQGAKTIPAALTDGLERAKTSALEAIRSSR